MNHGFIVGRPSAVGFPSTSAPRCASELKSTQTGHLFHLLVETMLQSAFCCKDDFSDVPVPYWGLLMSLSVIMHAVLFIC